MLTCQPSQGNTLLTAVFNAHGPGGHPFSILADWMFASFGKCQLTGSSALWSGGGTTCSSRFSKPRSTIRSSSDNPLSSRPSRSMATASTRPCRSCPARGQNQLLPPLGPFDPRHQVAIDQQRHRAADRRLVEPNDPADARAGAARLDLEMRHYAPFHHTDAEHPSVHHGSAGRQPVGQPRDHSRHVALIIQRRRALCVRVHNPPLCRATLSARG